MQHDKRVLQPMLQGRARPATTFFQLGSNVAPRRVPCWEQAEHEDGRERCQRAEREDGTHRHQSRSIVAAWGARAPQHTNSGDRQTDPDRAGYKAQDRSFDHEFAHEPTACRAERRAHGELPLPCQAAERERGWRGWRRR